MRSAARRPAVRRRGLRAELSASLNKFVSLRYQVILFEQAGRRKSSQRASREIRSKRESYCALGGVNLD
jgi:hypothetical protein